MEVERINELRENGTLQTVKMIQQCMRDQDDFVDFQTGNVEMELWHAETLFQFMKNQQDFKDCMKIIHSDNSRYNRLFKRVKKFMDMGTCLFLTLTFTDEVLASTSAESRRKYVRRFLKEYSNCFIANIDYGSKTGREHYHAIIVFDDVRFIDNWQYGFSNAQVIRDDFKSPERVSRYILKIANHFVKATTKRCRCIYSIWKSNEGLNSFKQKHCYFYENYLMPGCSPVVWSYTDFPDLDKDKQLCFWDHMPGNYSNFDRDDYM